MDSLPRKYVTTLYQNTDLKPTVRIGIVYYSLTRRRSPKHFEKIYLRLGPTVVSITLSPGEPLLPMLRHTLIVLLVYHSFMLDKKKSALDPSIPRDLARIKSLLNRPTFQKFQRYPISSLMALTSILMARLSTSGLYGRVSLRYSPDSLMIFSQIVILVASFFSLSLKRPNASFRAAILE
jgi:hypothetical protein